MMESNQLWQAALGEMELSVSKANFITWFKGTFIEAIENNKIVIGVPNSFTKNWLEQKYHQALLKAFKRLTQDKISELEFHVSSRKKKELERPEEEKTGGLTIAKAKILKTEEKVCPTDGLNQRYTFINFVVGKGNELAQAASLAVSRKPGEVYNPLFIYGGSGLGKTHLLHAIGNEVKKLHPDKKLLYVSSEQFVNEFVNAISTGTTNKFKNKYRTPDLLLIDDIQFVSGKEATQEELFHTFNELHNKKKQIVFSSDRPPKAIPALEKRLVTRFEWGMIADIAIPDLETRTAILEYKCKEKDFPLRPEFVRFIATNIQNNVRELEGALNKIIAFTQLRNVEPSLEDIKSIISSIASSPKKGALTAKQVLNTVAAYYDIKIQDLTGACRKKEWVTPRQITMYLMREEMNASYPSIGREIGNRDHTTAIHAYEKIKKAVNENEKITEDINLIKQRLYN